MSLDRHSPARAAWWLAKRVGMSPLLLRYGMHLVSSERMLAASFAGYVPTQRDVFVTTYLKSGTNWAMQVALQIAWRGAAEFDRVHDLVAWPDSPVPTWAVPLDTDVWSACPTGRRVIKTHNPAPSVPIAAESRYITVIRDPKEVMVSSYFFAGGLLDVLDRLSPQDWMRITLSGKPMWARHTLSWWRLRDEPNVLVLTFPQMKADLPAAVDRIAAHMGVELDGAERAAVIERAGLPWMKQHESKFAPPRLPFVPEAPIPRMVRRGAAGGADELYTQAELAEIDRIIEGQLDALGGGFPYRKLFGLSPSP